MIDFSELESDDNSSLQAQQQLGTQNGIRAIPYHFFTDDSLGFIRSGNFDNLKRDPLTRQNSDHRPQALTYTQPNIRRGGSLSSLFGNNNPAKNDQTFDSYDFPENERSRESGFHSMHQLNYPLMSDLSRLQIWFQQGSKDFLG